MWSLEHAFNIQIQYFEGQKVLKIRLENFEISKKKFKSWRKSWKKNRRATRAKIFLSTFADPPASAVSFWLTPLPPRVSRQFWAYPPTPLRQLPSVFGNPAPQGADVIFERPLTSFSKPMVNEAKINLIMQTYVQTL